MLSSKTKSLKPLVTLDQILRRIRYSIPQTLDKIGITDKLKSILRNKSSINDKEPQKNGVKAKDKEETVPMEVSNSSKDRK